MSKSSKGKGSQWERDVCKFLSNWIQGSERPYLFWRQPNSGGMATVIPENMENLSGDIRSISHKSEWFCNIFNIECKTGYKQASFDKHLKYNKSDPIKEFWEQVSGDAIKSKKQPMLIYKKTGMPVPWVGINISTYMKLKHSLQKYRYIILGWGGEDKLEMVYFFGMKEFFNNITPKIMVNSIEV